MALQKESDLQHVLNHPEMDVYKLAFLLGKPPELPAGGICGEDSTQVRNLEPTRVVVSAKMTCGGILVLADTFFPGWEAVVDGRSQEIREVYGVIRGVGLPAGAHQVTFQYRSPSVTAGFWFLGLSLVALAILYWFRGQLT